MKDMKKTRTHKSRDNRKKSAGGTLVGLFVGLVIGVVGAAIVVWYIQKTPPPFANKPQTAAVPNQPSTNTGSTAQPPLALPSKPGDPVPERRFDFYDILSGKKDTPDGSTKPPAPADNTQQTPTDKPKPETVAPSEPVYLQTGAFQNAGEADNQKARLAMQGMEATVQQYMSQDKVWYRVRLGPYKKADDAAAVRAELAKNGIHASVVK